MKIKNYLAFPKWVKLVNNNLQEERESQDDRGGQGEDGHDEPDPDVSRKPLDDSDHHQGFQRDPSKRNYDDHEHHVSWKKTSHDSISFK